MTPMAMRCHAMMGSRMLLLLLRVRKLAGYRKQNEDVL